MKYWIWNYETSNLQKQSSGHKATTQTRKLRSGRVGGFSHNSRWQQLTAAAHGNRSRQQMATTHSTDRGSRWQQIVAQIAASDRSNRSHVGCRFRRQIWFRQSQTSSLWFPQHSQQIGSVLCVVCVFHSVWFCVIHSVWFCVNCCEYLWVVRFELWGFALCRLHLVCSVRVYCVMCKL